MAVQSSKSAPAPVAATVEAQGEAQGTLTVEALAERAGATQRDMRKWLRVQAKGAGAATPGKGGRYAFTEAQAQALVAAYGRSKAQRGSTDAAAAIVAALAAPQA